MSNQEKFQTILDNSTYAVFFGGAGVSTESGIPDFRGENGLYQHTPEEIISHSFFMKHPDQFYTFYRDKMIYANALPNAAHTTLSHLEKIGKIRAVITQNIDGLHEKAGSKNVIELHGSIHRNHCMRCHTFYDLQDILANVNVPICRCGGMIKPDVTLYEEALPDGVFEKAIAEISRCDTLIVAGTSLSVYPAANLLHYFKGKHLVLINLTKTPSDHLATLILSEKVGSVFKAIHR